MPDDFLDNLANVGSDYELVMLGVEVTRRYARVVQLVETRFGEADGKRLYRSVHLARHHRDYRT